jgi:tRNA(Arg) A34 adenosine deaminase TadA
MIKNTKGFFFTFAIMYHTFSESFLASYLKTEFRTRCIQIHGLTPEYEDYSLSDRLSLVEALSPSTKVSQKVGCLLLSDNVVLVSASNSFLRNVGVHAEMGAISQYLNIFPAPIDPLIMAVTYSPCAECAQLIRFVATIRNVSYSFKYNDDGIRILMEGGVGVNELRRRSDAKNRSSSQKLHSYSKIPWTPNVTSIRLTRKLGGAILLSHSGSLSFDIRPFVIKALRNRSSASESLLMSYSGILNHRESLFLEVMGIRATTTEES